MFRSLAGIGTSNNIYSDEGRYGFRFQQEEEYPYRTLKEVRNNLYIAERGDQRWGMVDTLNQVIIPFEYIVIKHYVHGDFFLMTWGGKMGVLTSGLKPRYDFLYDDLLCYKKDSCLAQKDGLWGVVLSGDKVLVPFKYLDIEFGPKNGYKVKTETGWGTLDDMGTPVIPPRYTSIPKTQLKGYQLAFNGGQFDLYSTSTGEVTPLDIDEAVIHYGTWSGIVRKGDEFWIIEGGNLKPVLSYDKVETLGYGQTKEDMLYRVAKKGKYGVYSTASGLIADTRFTELEYRNGNSRNKTRLLVRNEASWTMIDATGKIIIPPTPSRIYEITPGFWVLEDDQRKVVKIVDNDGELVLEGPFSDIKVDYSVSSILQVKNEKGWQLYDIKAKDYLSKNVQEVKSFQDGFLIVCNADGWSLIKGREKRTKSQPQHGLLRLMDDNHSLRRQNWPLFRSFRRYYTSEDALDVRFGLIDDEGRQVLPNEYHRISLNFDSTLIVVKNSIGRIFDLKQMVLRDSTFSASNRSGYPTRRRPSTTGSPMDKGEPMKKRPEIGTTAKIDRTPLIFTSMGWKLVAPTADQMQLPDSITGISTESSMVMPYSGLYAIWRGNKIGAVDADGNIVIPTEYEDLVGARQSQEPFRILSYAKKNGKYGLINRQGQQLTPCKYDEIRAFQQGMARVRIGGKWGFIRSDGKEVIPAVYDSALPFVYGVSEVVRDGKRMFVDLENNCDWGCD